MKNHQKNSKNRSRSSRGNVIIIIIEIMSGMSQLKTQGTATNLEKNRKNTTYIVKPLWPELGLRADRLDYVHSTDCWVG